MFTIVIIKVPVAHPELAKVVASPRIFTDPQTGNVNGLWKGGNHGEGTQTTSMTRGCHDITVRSDLGLAAGACSGNGILLDISDPVHPVRIDAVTDPTTPSGTRPTSATMAPRCCSPTSGAAADSRVAAQPIR